MQNKPNFGNDKMSANSFITSKYEILYRSPGPKNKANSNPIQTQFKANKAKNKPNSNPILKRQAGLTIAPSLLDRSGPIASASRSPHRTHQPKVLR
jgi:hypothetical protein